MDKQSIKLNREWYDDIKSLYANLNRKVEDILKDLLIDNKVPIHSISARIKSLESIEKKYFKKEYESIELITDISGIRVITFVEDDLIILSNLIEETFFIDWSNSIDKSQSLGVDRVGYRSIHYVAKLPNERLELPEFQKFQNCKFEIQVRTILQHAWAEIEHDRDYKFDGELPLPIKRRFKVLAGVLELVDKEFNSITHDIIEFKKNHNNSDSKYGFTHYELVEFLDLKFNELIIDGITPEFHTIKQRDELMEELYIFGIRTLSDLKEIIPSDLIRNIIRARFVSKSKYYNYGGLLRLIMIIKNPILFFEKCWKNKWKLMSTDSTNLIESYWSNIREILAENQIEINQ